MIKKCVTLSMIIMLGACGSLNPFSDTEETRLEGDRLSLYDFEKTLQQNSNTQFGIDGDASSRVITLPESLRGGTDTEIQLVKPWRNKFWPQIGGYPNHAMKHIAFNEGEPERIWSSSIGEGGSDRMPLTAAPIMADGKIFTVNNDAEIYAFDSSNGKKIWETEIIKPSEDEVVIGGGLGFSGGRLYATNGFNEVIALDPENGSILWRTETKTPVRAAPVAIPGRVFVTTLSNETIAFDGNTGEKLWSHRGLSSDAGILGASAPALTKDAVIAAYGSGEIYALQIDSGTELWSQNLSPLARSAGQSNLTDIRALPVIDNSIVYATSYNNRMHAIDMRTGQPRWQIAIGSASTPWVSGNRVFVLEAQGTLLSIDNQSGNILWQTAIPQYEDMDDREDKIAWQGPVLAGGRLIIIGSHGMARDYNPVDGSLIQTWDIDYDNVLLPTALANETLYMLSDSGRLSAWQ